MMGRGRHNLTLVFRAVGDWSNAVNRVAKEHMKGEGDKVGFGVGKQVKVIVDGTLNLFFRHHLPRAHCRSFFGRSLWR